MNTLEMVDNYLLRKEDELSVYMLKSTVDKIKKSTYDKLNKLSYIRLKAFLLIILF